MFPPGEGCRYSNADYILLGRIIELGTGKTVSEEIRTRILAPLGLEHTFLGGEEPLPPSPIRSYRKIGTDCADCLAFENPSLAWSAGAMVSDASDLLRFGPALFGGNLLKPEMLAQMLDFEPIYRMERYGLGVREHDGGFGPLWGHPGQTIGFTSVLWYDPATHDTYVVLTNMNLQLDTLDPLVQAARACILGAPQPPFGG
jgi:D-alanyl-D-alanine carboxypeptidase